MNSIVYDTVTGLVTAKGAITIINEDGSSEHAESAVLDKAMSIGVATAFSTRLRENMRQNGLAGGPVDITLAAASAEHPTRRRSPS